MAEGFFAAVGKILMAQMIIIAIVATGFAMIVGEFWGLSAVLGGLTALLPNGYFAWYINRSKGSPAKKILHAFNIGESTKLILTAVLFAIILQVPHLKWLPLLVAYIAALSVFWFALLMR